jgi:ElaB/YqjD/DUF883 family membrane-anchored ribosome-binding protein
MAKNTAINHVKDELAVLKKKLAAYENRFEEKVQERPLASVGISFGAGVVIGALLGLALRRK